MISKLLNAKWYQKLSVEYVEEHGYRFATDGERLAWSVQTVRERLLEVIPSVGLRFPH